MQNKVEVRVIYKTNVSKISSISMFTPIIYRIVLSIFILMYITGAHVQRVQVCITFASGIKNRRGVKSLPWEEQTCHSLSPQFSHLTIIMSSENPFETNPIRKIAGSFERMLFYPLHLSRAPSPSPIEMDSSSDNPTR